MVLDKKRVQENIIREIYIKYTALCCVCHEHSSARNHCRRRRRQQFCWQMGRAVTFHDTFNRVRCFFCVCYVSVENHFIGWIINSCDNIWCFHMCQKKGIYLCLVHPASITPPPTPYSNRGCNSPYNMMRPHYTQKNRNRTKKKTYTERSLSYPNACPVLAVCILSAQFYQHSQWLLIIKKKYEWLMSKLTDRKWNRCTLSVAPINWRHRNCKSSNLISWYGILFNSIRAHIKSSGFNLNLIAFMHA